MATPKRRARKRPSPDPRRLSVPTDQLKWTCDSRQLPFRTTEELKPASNILGQAKAVRALGMGLDMDSPGYNVFVCGLPGTGRRTALRHLLERARPRGELQDLVCVPRFTIPDRPRLLLLPAGTGARLKRDVHGLFRQIARLRDKAADDNRAPSSIKKLVEKRLDTLRSRHSYDSRLDAYLRRLGAEIVARDGELHEEDFGVQVLVSRRARQRTPVYWPTHLTFSSLFGSFEKHRGDDKRPPGVAVGSVRPGALVEARGGYLVLSAAELIEVPNAWNALKSCLLTGRLNFFDHEGHPFNTGAESGAEAISADVKVVLIGDYQAYDMFMDMDPEFARVFRVRVDFDTETNRDRRVVESGYPRVIAQIVRQEGLRHLTAAAVAKVIEFAVRRAGRKSKISIQISAVADLIREANFWAERARKRLISGKEIDLALQESVDRLNLFEVKLSEMIRDGVILIDTAGSRVGQVNGLAIYDQGDYLFGKPSRITAETSMGRSGIINIERESGLSGRSHDKGIQILGGYLRSHFAQNRPLSLTASVCFEQSYQGIDGDSASATEIYAILSSLAGLPIRQDIAVTGSLNQKGDIQPIGGVNEKIEGFFDCVRAGRSTGREGVIIPKRNVPDLMLRDDVVKAVRRGEFTIYAIDTVEEGIEILTGCPAGRRRRNGKFPEGSVFDQVDRRLDQIVSGMKSFPEVR